MTDPNNVRDIEPLRVLRAANLPERDDTPWLIEGLWGRAACGFVSGPPKQGKTWLALDMAVAVASGTDCMGEFPVSDPGPVVAFFAEEHPSALRGRIARLAAARGIAIDDLDLTLVNEVSLRLDVSADLARLRKLVRRIRPKLLVLDPLVRLHRRAESDAGGMSQITGDLRELQREFDVSVMVVHHARKGRKKDKGGQELRGSGDLHAWADSSIYLDGKSPAGILVEHRAASPLAGRALVLNIGEHEADVQAVDDRRRPPREEVLSSVLQCFEEGMTATQDIAKKLGMRKADVIAACSELVTTGRLRKVERLYRLPQGIYPLAQPRD